MTFDKNLKKAIEEIKSKNFYKAKEYIHLAILADDSSAEAHNLLGIIAELTGDLTLAGKHYRASCSLSPTFKAPCNNLQRITSFYYVLDKNSIDYGDKYHEEDIPYFVEYDNNKVGHLIKKIMKKAI